MGSCLITHNKRIPNSSTYTASSRSESIDMGIWNLYRYVNTSGVPNSNSGTYSATSRSSSLDMGATNTYRYVSTSGVPSADCAYVNWGSWNWARDASFSTYTTTWAPGGNYTQGLLVLSCVGCHSDNDGNAWFTSVTSNSGTLTQLFDNSVFATSGGDYSHRDRVRVIRVANATNPTFTIKHNAGYARSLMAVMFRL